MSERRVLQQASALARALVLTLGAVAHAAGIQAGDRERPFVPYQARGPLAEAEGGAAVLSKSGVTIRAREFSGEERGAWIRGLTASTVDPFAVVKDGRPYFRTFLLEIANDGAADLLFNSAFCRLRAGDEHHFPHGYGGLYRVLNVVIPDPVQLSGLAQVLEETPITVQPGGRASKLLVFDRVPDKKKVELQLTGLKVGEEPFAVRIPFERPKR